MPENSIAVDIMGGDNAPESIIEGVRQALIEYDSHLLLAGPSKLIESELKNNSSYRGSYQIVPSTQTVEMHEDPIHAVRRKKNSSLMLAVDAVKQGDAQVLVSAGNTGAVMVATKLKWGVQTRVERPAIATLIPTLDEDYTILIDVGANVDCTPKHLVQFGLMGAVYSELILGKENPSVALLNLGEEVLKGNELTKEAFDLFEEQPFNFMGNVEGNQINDGVADVIVCDGFVGNVVLKLSEGLADTLFGFIEQSIYQSFQTRLGGWLLKPVFKNLLRIIDPSEVGGAPLLGLNGGCIIAHGSSTPKAIKNAIRRARLFIREDCNSLIGERMQTLNFPEDDNDL